MRSCASTLDRQDLVLVSKAGVRTWRTGERSSVADASRGSLLDTLDTSLARLGTDHLDLLLVQVPDPSTSLEETAHALSLAVSSGRTRYVGIANHPTWASVRMHDLLSECGRGPGLAAVEVEHSLLSRGIERELRPASQALGLRHPGVRTPGQGRAHRQVPGDDPTGLTGSFTSPALLRIPYLGDVHRGVVEAVATAASGLDRKPAEVALAWARDAPGIASTIVGARTPAQLQGVLAADDLELPVQIRHALDEVTSLQLGYPERF